MKTLIEKKKYDVKNVGEQFLEKHSRELVINVGAKKVCRRRRESKAKRELHLKAVAGICAYFSHVCSMRNVFRDVCHDLTMSRVKNINVKKKESK